MMYLTSNFGGPTGHKLTPDLRYVTGGASDCLSSNTIMVTETEESSMVQVKSDEKITYATSRWVR
jgi:hypothetical protein